jgi:hypothetical protein
MRPARADLAVGHSHHHVALHRATTHRVRDALRHAGLPIHTRALVALGLLAAPAASAQNHVIVALDVDAATPGLQHTINVSPGTTLVPDVAVYIYDPTGTHTFDGIGFFGIPGGGISLGHTTNPANTGRLTAMREVAVNPLDPGGAGMLMEKRQLEKSAFDGPEVNYIEFANRNSPFPTSPVVPVFTVHIDLQNADRGDIFDLYLLDFIAAWSGGQGGAFSADLFPLNSGGDAVPDNTLSTYGLDADPSQPVPPATFLVDYRDGPPGGGPATITIAACYPDCDSSTGIGVLDIFDFLCFQNRYDVGNTYACDCDTSTGPGVCDIFDFLCFQNAFGAGCP